MFKVYFTSFEVLKYKIAYLTSHSNWDSLSSLPCELLVSLFEYLQQDKRLDDTAFCKLLGPNLRHIKFLHAPPDVEDKLMISSRVFHR